jgi:hypothetical protein
MFGMHARGDLRVSETITLLTCEPGRRLAKRYTPESVKPDAYDGGDLYQAASVEIADLADLFELLEGISEDASVCVVRGAIHPDVSEGEWVRRLSQARGPNHPEGECEAAFLASAHRWLAVDVDESATPFDVTRVRESLDAFRETLPPELRTAAMIWQCSAQAHIAPNVRGRAWFWLTHEADDRALRRWADFHGFDHSLYTPVAPHYTAAPVFANGAADPLAGNRLHWFDGTEATLDLTVAPTRERAEPTGTGDAGPGDPYTPAVNAILGVLGDATDHEGSRWHVLGALGGVLRRMQWPQAPAERLARDWLASVPGADVENGVRRIIGAWARPAGEVTGTAELVSILQNDTMAGAIVHASSMPRTLKKGLDVPAFQAVQPVTAIAETDPDDPLAAFCAPDEYFDGELPYVCAPLGVVAGKCMGINGPAAAGKSPLALWYSICAAAGRQFCGHAFEAPVRTLYLSFEDGIVISRRRARMCRALGLDPKEIPLWIRRAQTGMTDVFVTAVGDFCVKHGISQVIVDTLTSANRGGARQNDAEYAELLWKLGDLSEQVGAAVIVLTHSNKEGGTDLRSIAGTQAIAAAFQTVWTITPTGKGAMTVTCARAPEERFEPFAVVIEDVPTPDAVNPDPKWGLRCAPGSVSSGDSAVARRPQVTQARLEAERSTQEAIEAIWAELGNAPTAIKIAAVPHVKGCGVRAMNRALSRLTKRGAIEHTGGGQYRRAAGWAGGLPETSESDD